MKAIDPRPSIVAPGLDVLIIEDETKLRDMLIRAVREMGFRPVGVASAESARRHLEQHPADILLLDLNLPGMSGMDFLAVERKRDPAVQAIILTGFGNLEEAKAAIHLNVVDFLSKPCPLGDLEVALVRARARRLEAVGRHGSQPAIALRGSSRMIDVMSLNEPAAGDTDSGVGAGTLEDLERRHILAVLEKHNGNRAATAAELGISLRKLYYRLHEYQQQGLVVRDE